MTTVRTATYADAEAIAHVHVRSWREGYANLLDERALAARSLHDRNALWRRVLGQTDSLQPVLVAVEDTGEIAGFCSLRAPTSDEDLDAERVAEVTALYVDPSHWRRGVAVALLGEALARLRAGGWTKAVLWVLSDNEPALALYERFGFRPDGSEGVHHPSGHPQRRLALKLQPLPRNSQSRLT